MVLKAVINSLIPLSPTILPTYKKTKKPLIKINGFLNLLAEQNMLHHKPPKFPKDKPIKHLGSKSAF